MMRLNRHVGFVCVGLFLATIWLANYSIAHWGTPPPFPGGPHTVPVGFGYVAPSGVLFVGIAFTFRDLAQMALGRWWIAGAVVVGAALSYFIAPAFALASGVAFLCSEGLEFAVYTPLAERGRWLAGVALSNTVGTIIDSVLFLWIAFGSLNFIEGQIIGKTWMTLLALALLAPIRMRRPARV
jgi:uncharacterized PurR-regulated membrane protein YhhQ (DUF165 family)